MHFRGIAVLSFLLLMSMPLAPANAQELPVADLSITKSGPAQATVDTDITYVVTVTNLAVCEALTFATKAGLDAQKTISAVGGGAAGSWQLTNLGPRMVAGDFAPGFMIKLQQKDLLPKRKHPS